MSISEDAMLRKKAAIAIAKLGQKCQTAGLQTDPRKAPKKDWIKSGIGYCYRPDKVKEAIKYYSIALEVDYDIGILNTKAIAHEIDHDFETAKALYENMLPMAEEQNLVGYISAAKAGVERCEENL